MDRLQLSPAELRELDELADEFEGEFKDGDFGTEEALSRAAVIAHQLPLRIREHLTAFRLEQLSGVLCVSGYRVNQDRVGRTPAHWREHAGGDTTREELLLLVLSSLAGDPFCWATQQDGRMIHDIVPVKGHENEQLGSSSESLLTWHTEDAFHPMRGDYLSFACLRNPYRAATTVGYVDALVLTDETRGLLFQERFMILPDESHLVKNNSAGNTAAFSGIERMRTRPDPIAVLFGDPERPYLRADPYFMAVAEGDEQARVALDELSKAMDEVMFDLRLESGDFCFLDNFRAVHGRKPFSPRHDGTDRWLKRINITGDLRKSKAVRTARAVVASR